MSVLTRNGCTDAKGATVLLEGELAPGIGDGFADPFDILSQEFHLTGPAEEIGAAEHKERIGDGVARIDRGVNRPHNDLA